VVDTAFIEPLDSLGEGGLRYIDGEMVDRAGIG
jgi:hypothetical protein